MNQDSSPVSRRTLLRGSAVAGTAFQIIRPELVRGQGKEKLRAGVVGLGGRGTQAVIDFLSGTENTEVVAAAELFEDRLEGSIRRLRESPQTAAIRDRIKIDPDKRFVGFEAYKRIMASDVDIVFLATPPGYRPEHFEAAINAKKHVFCEKPFGTDATGVRRFMEAVKKSEQMKLTVMSGAQRRFDRNYVETIQKIKDGQIGDITAAYAYWVGTPVIQQPKGRPANMPEMTWQNRNWYSYLWLCGDQIVEQHLHNIDVINWVMGTHPVKVMATGGAVWRPRDEVHGNIYDHISSDFEYANGVRMSSYCRQYPSGPEGQGIARKVEELVVGTKGRSNCNDLVTKQPTKPYVAEHTAMVASIRGDGPYVNHGMAVAESTLTCIMARESAYSGAEVTWDMIMNSKQDLSPKQFAYEATPEVPPFPVPGRYKFI